MKRVVKQNNKKGFTLVEILMGMSLTVLVGGILYLMHSTGISTVNKGATKLLLTSEVRNKMEHIVQDLRNTKEVLEVKPDYLKIRTYKYSIDHQEPGEDALVTVEYEVERNEKRHILWRNENRENPKKLLLDCCQSPGWTAPRTAAWSDRAGELNLTTNYNKSAEAAEYVFMNVVT